MHIDYVLTSKSGRSLTASIDTTAITHRGAARYIADTAHEQLVDVATVSIGKRGDGGCYDISIYKYIAAEDREQPEHDGLHLIGTHKVNPTEAMANATTQAIDRDRMASE